MKKTITITEALAEIKTLAKRIEAKRGFVQANFGRHSMTLDPMESEGGAPKLVAEAMQAADDLATRQVDLRVAIQKKNLSTKIEVEGVKKTVTAWLVWRREIEADEARFIKRILASAQKTRQEIRDKLPEGVEADLLMHLSEADLFARIERHEKILGDLDGQLTLTNSTTTISV